MTTAAASGHGAKIQIGDGATPVEAFNDIPELTVDIMAAPVDNPTEDVTNHQSAGWAEKIPDGVKQVPNIPCSGNWLSENTIHQQIRTDAFAKPTPKRNFKITTTPDTTPKTYAFSGYIRNFQTPYPVRGGKKFAFEVEVTGAITIT